LLDLPSVPKILDVGGYPGTLLDFLPEYYCITADTAFCPRAGYVCSSGYALPFKDKSFDVVLSTDTLEHVAESEREKFITEMLRVAKSYAIVAAPFDTAEVRFCDEKIADLHEVTLVKPHSWLGDHIDIGLPKIDWLTELLERRNVSYEIFSNGYVVTWFLLFGLDYLLQLFPSAGKLALEYHAIINKVWMHSEQREPSYRKVFLIKVSGGSIAGEVVEGIGSRYCEVKEENDILERLHVINDLFRVMVKTINEVFGNNEVLNKTLTSKYVEQLEKAIKYHESEIGNLREQIKLHEEKTNYYERKLLVRILLKLGFL
jgi:hypothetical protein